jgi:hypothetical protein
MFRQCRIFEFLRQRSDVFVGYQRLAVRSRFNINELVQIVQAVQSQPEADQPLAELLHASFKSLWTELGLMVQWLRAFRSLSDRTTEARVVNFIGCRKGRSTGLAPGQVELRSVLVI